VKSDINPGKVHPQLIGNGHLVDGALVGAGSLQQIFPRWHNWNQQVVL